MVERHRVKQLRITEVEALPSYHLRIKWENGQEHIVDLTTKIKRVSSLKPLQDRTLFAQAHVGEWGWAVVWNDEIDLDGAQLYRAGEEAAGKAYPHDAFVAWMQRNSLSYTTAAKALGLSQRTIVNYSLGHRPIPVLVGLACRGYDAAMLEDLVRVG